MSDHEPYRLRIYLGTNVFVEFGCKTQNEAEEMLGSNQPVLTGGGTMTFNTPDKVICINSRHVTYMVAEPWP